MICNSRHSTPRPADGFTIVEVIFGLMVLATVASTAFFAFAQINRLASVSRLYTAAQMICQTQINTIQGDTPFNPQNSVVPTELTTGTANVATTIYADPATGNTLVSGTITRIVSDISNTSQSEYAYKATVQVGYTYRSKYYQVVQSTVRASDQ